MVLYKILFLYKCDDCMDQKIRTKSYHFIVHIFIQIFECCTTYGKIEIKSIYQAVTVYLNKLHNREMCTKILSVVIIGGMIAYRFLIVSIKNYYKNFHKICYKVKVTYEYVYWFNFPVWKKIVGARLDVPSLYHLIEKLPNTLIYLDMGAWFNKSISFPKSLKYLKMSDAFDKIIELPECLLCLEMGHYFNQPIILVESLEYLKMGHCFNQPIKLPNSLLFLIIGRKYEHKIVLPQKLCFISINANYNHRLILPESLKMFVFAGFTFRGGHLIDWYFDNMPNSVTNIALSTGYEYSCKNLPNLVKYITEMKNWISISDDSCLKLDIIRELQFGQFVKFNAGKGEGDKDMRKKCCDSIPRFEGFNEQMPKICFDR